MAACLCYPHSNDVFSCKEHFRTLQLGRILFNVWIITSMFLGAFVVHNFLLLPQIVYHRRHSRYVWGTVVLMVAFAFLQYLFHTTLAVKASTVMGQIETSRQYHMQSNRCSAANACLEYAYLGVDVWNELRREVVLQVWRRPTETARLAGKELGTATGLSENIK